MERDTVRLVTAMAFLLCVSGCARRPVNTSSLHPADIEAIEAIQRPNGGMFSDRLGYTATVQLGMGTDRVCFM